MTPEQAQWIRVHRETFEQALREAEQVQQEMMGLVSHLSAGPMQETWEQKLALMAERLRRQREVWERAVAEEDERPEPHTSL